MEDIDIIFILDKSGSMQSMGVEPVDSVNQFINSQKELKDNTKFTLYTFNDKTHLIIDDKPLEVVGPFAYDEYIPSNMTALYDAIGEAINKKKNSDRNKNVVMVILTDGEENCSKKYTSKVIQRMTKEMEEEYNWKFIYLGANQDAFKVGTKMGISNSSPFDGSARGLSAACKMVNVSVSKYKSTGNDAYLKTST